MMLSTAVPLKRLVIAADLAPNKLGSLERQIAGVADAFADRGYDVTLLFADSVSEVVKSGLGWGRFTLRDDLGPLSDSGAQKRWLTALRGSRPNVLWTHFFPATGKWILDVRKACPQSRIVCTDHVSRGSIRRSPLKRLYCRARAWWLRSTVDQYIAVSQFVAKRLIEFDHVPPARVRVVYNGVEVDKAAPIQTAERTYVACVAHMRPSKGCDVLLRALAILRRQGIDLECRLVGDGPHLDEYRALADSLGLEKVSFLGLRDDVSAILAGAAITVVPSRWPEAFGLAAAESLAAGTPVIASRVGALPEVVDHEKTGLLVTPESPEALAEAIVRLWRSPDLRAEMGAAGRVVAARSFHLKTQTAQLVNVLAGEQMPTSAV